jgi:hypothetical protein
MNTTSTEVSASLHTGIYKPKENASKENESWHIEGFFRNGWFSTESGTDCLHHFLYSLEGSCEWVASNDTKPFRRNDKFIPYHYGKLATFITHFLCIYWDREREVAVQVDSKALRFGITRTRTLTAKELNGYVFTEFRRACFLLQPTPGTLVFRTFNPRWCSNPQDMFPISFSKKELEVLLLPFSLSDREIPLILESRSEVDGTYYSVPVWTALKLPEQKAMTHLRTTEQPIISHLCHLLEQNDYLIEMSSSEFNAICDQFGWKMDKPMGRGRVMKKALMENEGVVMERKQYRTDKGHEWFYRIYRMKAELAPIQTSN